MVTRIPYDDKIGALQTARNYIKQRYSGLTMPIFNLIKFSVTEVSENLVVTVKMEYKNDQPEFIYCVPEKEFYLPEWIKINNMKRGTK